MRKTTSKKPGAARKRAVPAGNWRLRHILVPMDFSGYARQALTCAVPLARKHRAKISLVHVTRSPVVIQTTPDGGIALPVNAPKLLAVAQTHLEDLAGKLLPKGVRGQTIVREGNAATEVVTVAKKLKADLVVLSSTGHAGLRRLVLGSTAERIVRHAHCPVLTVRRSQDKSARRLLELRAPLYPRQLRWRRILVPLDFSPTSLKALKTAVPLAKECGGRLLLLNVIEPSPYPTGMEGAALVKPVAALARTARTQLPRVARRFVPKSVRVTSLVGHGRPADAIVKTAEEKRADVIVISTHGLTGLDRLLMGSAAEQVVREAKCPVLVVRKPIESKRI